MRACTRSMVEGYRRCRVQLTATHESTQCRKTEDLNQYMNRQSREKLTAVYATK